MLGQGKVVASFAIAALTFLVRFTVQQAILGKDSKISLYQITEKCMLGSKSFHPMILRHVHTYLAANIKA